MQTEQHERPLPEIVYRMQGIADKLESAHGARAVKAQELDECRDKLHLIDAELLLAKREDGTPAIDGKNEAIREAQLTLSRENSADYVAARETLRDLTFGASLLDADIEYWRTKASFVRAEIRLQVAQMESDLAGGRLE